MAQKEDPGWRLYLNSNAIKNGEFSGLKNIPLCFIKSYEDSLIKDLEIFLLNRPQKIVNLINLKNETRVYLKGLVSNQLNRSVEKTVESTIRILKHEKNKEESIPAVYFIFSCLNQINQIYFKNSVSNELSRIESYQKEDFKNVFED